MICTACRCRLRYELRRVIGGSQLWGSGVLWLPIQRTKFSSCGHKKMPL